MFPATTAPVLAVALPLSLDDVVRHLAAPERHDYVRAMQGAIEGTTAGFVWETHFKPVVQDLRSLIPELSQLGVKVVLRVGRNDLRQLFTQFKLVTIVAHWKSAKLLPGDIREPAEVARRILNHQNRLCSILRSLLDHATLDRLAASTTPTSLANKVILARLLNGAIISGIKLFTCDVPADVKLVLIPLEVQEFNRQQIDAWFEDLIIPGSRVELHDGLISPSDFAELIPADYAGTIHLVNCHSVLLQNAISSPIRRVMASEDVIPPLPFLELYLSVVQMLQQSNSSYEDLWLTVLEALQRRELFGSREASRGWQSRVGNWMRQRFNKRT